MELRRAGVGYNKSVGVSEYTCNRPNAAAALGPRTLNDGLGETRHCEGACAAPAATLAPVRITASDNLEPELRE